MTQISRLKASEISNGNLINADDINAELNQLVSNDNSQDTRITDLESGDTTLTGTKTFDTAPKTDEVSEKTDNTGVTVDGVLLKDGYINLAVTGAQISSVDTGTDTVTTASAHGLTSGQPIKLITTGTLPGGLSTGTVYYVSVETTTTFKVYTDDLLTTLVNITSSGSGSHELSSDPASLNDGDLWYNTADNVLKVQLNGAVATITTSALGWPKGYKAGPPIEYVSTTEVKIPAGFKCRDDADSVNINVSTDITIDITTVTGASVVDGLMNGLTESTDQWYYVWVIAKAGGLEPAGLLTTSSSTIATYPTDYLYKRLLGVIRNDASGDFIPFQIGSGWPHRPEVYYQIETTYYQGAWQNGPNNVLSAGTATSLTDLDLSDFIPPISKRGILHSTLYGSTSLGHVQWLEKGGTESVRQMSGSSGAVVTSHSFQLSTDASQVVQYKNTSMISSGLDVRGYVITEVD